MHRLWSTRMPRLIELPVEILLKIVEQLGAYELVSLGSTCQFFAPLHHNGPLWSSLFRKQCPATFQALTSPIPQQWHFTAQASKVFLHFFHLHTSRKWAQPPCAPSPLQSQLAQLLADTSSSLWTSSASASGEQFASLAVQTLAVLELRCILGTMRQYGAQKILQLTICFLLRRLCYKDAKAQRIVAEEGGIGLLTDLMGRFPVDVDIQVEVIVALINMSMDPANKTELVHKYAGIDLVTAAMKRFPLDGRLHQFSCSLIGNLATEPELRGKMGAAGVIHVVIDSMRLHASDPAVLVQACRALRHISYQDESNRKAVLEQGLQHVMEMSCRYRDHREVQAAVCLTLYYVVQGMKEESVKMASMRAVLQAMETCGEDAKVQYESCLAMAGLTVMDEREVGEQTIHLVLRAMDIHIAVADMQKMGAAALADLARNRRNAERILAGGGLCLIKRAMEVHRDDVLLLETMCSILADLTARSSFASSAIQLGLPHVIAVAYNRFQWQSRIIAKEAKVALSNMHTTPSTALHLDHSHPIHSFVG